MGFHTIVGLALTLSVMVEPSGGLDLGRGAGRTESGDEFWPKLLKAKKYEDVAITATTTGEPLQESTGAAKFVVVSQPRSGARFVMEMLNSHPHLRCGYEELHKCCEIQKGLEGLVCDEGEMQKVLDNWFAEGGFWADHPGVKGRGFQVHLNAGLLRKDGSPTGVRDYLLDHDVKVVFLWRRNELRRHISMAAKTGQWAEQSVQMSWNLSRIAHPMHDEDVKSVRDFKPTLATGASLLSKLRHGKVERVHAKAVLRDVPQSRKTTFFYEDLLNATNPDSDAVWQQLQEFLGVPAVPVAQLTALSTHVHMQNDIGELVKNAEEVRSSLAGTEYELLLK